MLFKSGKEITSLHKGDKILVSLYRGARLVWEYVRSCFGRGYWLDNYQWSDKDGWRNE